MTITDRRAARARLREFAQVKTPELPEIADDIRLIVQHSDRSERIEHPEVHVAHSKYADPPPLVDVMHDAPCVLSIPGNWRQQPNDEWEPIVGCSCNETPDDVEITRDQSDIIGEPDEEEVVDGGSDHVDLSEMLDAGAVISSGGWVAPSEGVYGLFGGIPEITARRGGLSFTMPKGIGEMSKKELRAEVERLRKALAETQAALRTQQRRRHKAERKVRRLIKIIERNI